YQFGDEWEFYDLDTDPDELTNQYQNPYYAKAISAMKERLKALQTQYQEDSDISEMPKEWQEKMRTPQP
ncbi:MAG: DUF4976 domain-containing protein, partial [Verrucomicrobiae bacterium]|nr:DUF4976 domain-containing protein [Verrucomicrobiae bacterium]